MSSDCSVIASAGGGAGAASLGPHSFFGFLMTSPATGLSPGNEDEGPCFVTDHERLLSK